MPQESRHLSSALLLGDIHTEADLLATALTFAPRGSRVLSVGDIVDGPDDPVRCIELLRNAHADVVTGNHERWVNQGHPFEAFDYPAHVLDWLSALPATREYDTPGGSLLLCHGVGANDMAQLRPDTAGYALECLDDVWRIIRSGRHRFVIGGHTHVPMVRTIDGVTFINPGTLVSTQQPAFMLVDFAAREVQRWTLLPQPTLAETIALS